MDIGSITATVTGLKTAGDIVKSLMESKALSEVSGAITELQSQLFSAQSNAISANAEQFAMIEEIRTLKEKVTKIKAWEREKDRYQLISPWQGAVVYALKDSMKGMEPPHWICANCYEDGEKRILTQQKKGSGFVKILCPKCGAWFDSIMRHSNGILFEYA